MKELIKTLEGHSESVYALCLIGPGQLASGSVDNSIKLWDIATGQCLKTLTGHSKSVYALCPLGSGQLASGSWDKSIKIWDIATGECLKTLTEHSNSVYALCLVGPGQLASGSMDNSIKVWDIATGECLKTLTGHSHSVYALCPLGPGQLASGSGDNSIKVWDIATGHCLKTLTGHSSGVSALCLLGPGQLASGSYDNSIKIWDIATGQCLKTLPGHSNTVFALCSLGSGQLAAGSVDNNIKIWDIATGECLKTLTGHSRSVKALCLVGPGQLVSGSWDKSIKVWALPHLKEEAQAMRAQGMKAYTQKAYAVAKFYFTQALAYEFVWEDAEIQSLRLHRGLSALALGLYTEAVKDLDAVSAEGYAPEAVAQALAAARRGVAEKAAALEALLAKAQEAGQASGEAALAADLPLPEDLCCPITGQLLYDPVVTEDGECYEREAITQWLSSHNTSPRTNVVLAHKNLVPNRATLRQVQTFLEKHPRVLESDSYYLPQALKARTREAVLQRQVDSLKELLRLHRGLLFQSLGETYLLPLVVAQGHAESLRLVVENSGARLKVLLKQLPEPRDLLLALAKAGLRDTFQAVVETLGYSAKALVNTIQAWQGQHAARAEALRALFAKLPVVVSYSLRDILELLEFSSEETVSLLPYLGPLDQAFYRALAQQCINEANLGGAMAVLKILVGEERKAGLSDSLKAQLEDAAFLGLAAKDFDRLTGFIQLGAPLEGGTATGSLFRALVEAVPQKAFAILAEAGVSLPEAVLQEWMKQAIEEGQLGLAHTLQAQGASLQYQDEARNTFLHLAAAKGYQAMALWLMEQGCSEKAKNAQGLRPREVALAQGFPALAEQLAERHRALKFQFFMAPLQAKIDRLTDELEQMKTRLQP